MGKKLTIEYIRDEFEKEGYTLLSEEYVGSGKKLDYICSKGHEHSITWGHWQQGHRCKYCAIKLQADNRKNNLIDVIKSFESEGYTLSIKEYTNCVTKMNYVCSNGHEHSITWNDWQQGNRCPYCYGNYKPTIEQVKNSFEQSGYILLSKEYIGSKTKLEYICSNGHNYDITWDSWQRGARCSICAGNIKLTLEQVREAFEKEDCVLLSEKYIGAHTKLNYICSKGHNHSIKWNDWQGGVRCQICKGINYSILYSGANNPNWLGGKSYEPYCEIWKDREYKQDIRERDDSKCLNPCCCSKKPYDLTIHHIDYNKKNCRPSNLITICRSCNAKANYDRDWHITWYQAIIKNRYGGVKCL
jgi:hypothetical protein